MNETTLSVESRVLHRLAQHFLMRGSQYLEPYLWLLGAEYDGSRHQQAYGFAVSGNTSFKWLGDDDPFFTALATNRDTYAVASPADFGGLHGEVLGMTSSNTPGISAPWARQLTEDWNGAIAARATDMIRVIDELYKLGDALVRTIEDYEAQDVYNAVGIQNTETGYDFKDMPTPETVQLTVPD